MCGGRSARSTVCPASACVQSERNWTRPSVTKEWQTSGALSKEPGDGEGQPAATHASQSASPFAVIRTPLSSTEGVKVGLLTSPFHPHEPGPWVLTVWEELQP